MAITSDQYLSLVRGAMNLIGGALVTSGVVSGSGMESASGIIIPLASLIWGWMVHAPAATVARAEVIKEKGLA